MALLHFVCFDFGINQVVDVCCELLDGHSALVAFALYTNRYLALSSLLLAYDEQERDTLQLVVTNLTANLLVTLVNLYANICLTQTLGNIVSIVVELLRDRQDDSLVGSDKSL